jgi:hypothetical protein
MIPISSKPYFFTYLFLVIIIFIIFLVSDLILKKKKNLDCIYFSNSFRFLFPNNNWSNIAFCDIHVPATLQKKNTFGFLTRSIIIFSRPHHQN